MMSHPEQAARNRYSRSFQSNIFEPPPQQSPSYQPAGKRRDQTSFELFGSHEEKNLRPMPKTFQPKEDEYTAREKKQHFLTSHQQPERTPRPAEPVASSSEAGFVHSARPGFNPYQEEEEVDTNIRRQEELKSKLFGRETPAAQLNQQSGRLMPNDFAWHSIPEQRNSQEMSHTERAYKEKCSAMFDHRSPQLSGEWEASQRQLQEEEMHGEAKRREDVYYSDLFGRSADRATSDMPMGETRRSRARATGPEAKIAVHQDWTNAKTELMHARESQAETAHQRKCDELYKGQGRVFGEGGGSWQPAERLDAVTHDNSDKLRSARGRGTQEIHQAHLRTSMTPNEFYEEAQNSKHWEVAELHLSGLHSSADDEYVRKLCQGFDLQLVKVAAEVDPVRNLCKGRAKVMVRYNPKRESVDGLVRKFENSNLKVEM